MIGRKHRIHHGGPSREHAGADCPLSEWPRAEARTRTWYNRPGTIALGLFRSLFRAYPGVPRRPGPAAGSRIINPRGRNSRLTYIGYGCRYDFRPTKPGD